MAVPNSDPKFDRYSKENRWYYKDLNGHLAPSSRKLLEEYSHIPAKNIGSHIYKMRDILWSHAPYPCIGQFKFLTLNLPNHSQYTHLLSLLQPSTSSPGPYLLDLGCCVAQELRSLSYAGIPSQNLYGSDLISSYLTTSYELFNDKERFKGTLVQANIFSDEIFENEFKGWEEKFKVVHAGLFLHLFNWKQQLIVCENIVKLLSGEKEAMFLGEMVGCQGVGEMGASKDVSVWKNRAESKQFLHDEESFGELWEEVAEKTGTKGSWRVQANFRIRRKEGGKTGSEGCSFFVGKGIGWIAFSVQRI